MKLINKILKPKTLEEIMKNVHQMLPMEKFFYELKYHYEKCEYDPQKIPEIIESITPANLSIKVHKDIKLISSDEESQLDYYIIVDSVDEYRVLQSRSITINDQSVLLMDNERTHSSYPPRLTHHVFDETNR